MESFTKPEVLDGGVLIAELEAAGVKVVPNSLGIKCPSVDVNNLMWLDIAAKDKSKAAAVIVAHAG
jgi:hypothetical protein